MKKKTIGKIGRRVLMMIDSEIPMVFNMVEKFVKLLCFKI